jgi:hypothetical protein
MRCPQCGAETPDEEWNCVSCRINVYWASQHYRELAQIRTQQGLRETSDTPAFLRQAHDREMSERVDRYGRIEHKVRRIARLTMRRGSSATGSDMPGEDVEAGVESAWNNVS